jgi:hypothetical protein
MVKSMTLNRNFKKRSGYSRPYGRQDRSRIDFFKFRLFHSLFDGDGDGN